MGACRVSGIFLRRRGVIGNVTASSATVTIDNTASATALSDYQTQISLTSTQAAIFAASLSDGSDIRITDSAGRPVPYWIESWNKTAQTASIWARVPEIPASSSVTLTMSYGSGNSSGTNPFTVPPVGNWTRPASAVGVGLAENMIFDGTTYAIVVSNQAAAGGQIDLWTATSPTGPWTLHSAVITAGAAGLWDSGFIDAPHILYESGTYYIYYSGYSSTVGYASGSIGYATATSLTGPYTKASANPVLTNGTSGSWDSSRVWEPFVYYSTILGKWVMLFMGDSGTATTPVEQVGMATGPSVIGPWTVDTSNPALAFGPSLSFDEGTVADPWAVEINGVAYIGYSAAPGSPGVSSNWVMGSATTTDYVTFTKMGQTLTLGPSGNFDEDSAFRGAVTNIAGTWYWPYAGKNSSGTYQWGVATLSADSTSVGCPPDSIFGFYDDFPGSSLDTNYQWHPVGGTATAAVSGNQLTLSTTGSTGGILAKKAYAPGYAVDVRSTHPNADGTGNHAAESGWSGQLPPSVTDTIRIYDYNQTVWVKEADSGGSQTSSNMAQSIDTNVHTFTAAFVNLSDAQYQVDSNPVESLTTDVPQINVAPWVFVYGANGYSTDQVVDWVRTRTWATTPPTVTVG